MAPTSHFDKSRLAYLIPLLPWPLLFFASTRPLQEIEGGHLISQVNVYKIHFFVMWSITSAVGYYYRRLCLIEEPYVTRWEIFILANSATMAIIGLALGLKSGVI